MSPVYMLCSNNLRVKHTENSIYFHICDFGSGIELSVKNIFECSYYHSDRAATQVNLTWAPCRFPRNFIFQTFAVSCKET